MGSERGEGEKREVRRREPTPVERCVGAVVSGVFNLVIGAFTGGGLLTGGLIVLHDDILHLPSEEMHPIPLFLGFATVVGTVGLVWGAIHGWHTPVTVHGWRALWLEYDDKVLRPIPKPADAPTVVGPTDAAVRVCAKCGAEKYKSIGGTLICPRCGHGSSTGAGGSAPSH